VTKNDKLEVRRYADFAVEGRVLPSSNRKSLEILSNCVDEKFVVLAILLLQSYKKVYKMSLTKRLFSLKREMLAGIKRFLEE